MLFTSSLRADNGEYLDAAIDEMNALYNTGPSSGCQDCVFNAVSSSMIGWGVGLAIGIAVLTGLVVNSKKHTTTTTTTQ
jgi:hypothetical protein